MPFRARKQLDYLAVPAGRCEVKCSRPVLALHCFFVLVQDLRGVQMVVLGGVHQSGLVPEELVPLPRELANVLPYETYVVLLRRDEPLLERHVDWSGKTKRESHLLDSLEAEDLEREA